MYHTLYMYPYPYIRTSNFLEIPQSGHAKYIRKMYTSPKGHRAQSTISQKVEPWKGAQRFEFGLTPKY